MASRLSARTAAIESAIALLHFFHDQLHCFHATLGEVLEAACKTDSFAGMGYLSVCRDRMRRGEPFPTAWRSALEQLPGSLPSGEAAQLAALSDVLGVTDLDSQLTALNYVREQLVHRLELARGQQQKNQKLYSTLGVLAGFAAAILLI